jgi:hypothetical protein
LGGLIGSCGLRDLNGKVALTQLGMADNDQRERRQLMARSKTTERGEVQVLLAMNLVKL